MFYLENRERGVVGNCLLFWRKGGRGYTCDINDAELFTEADALEIIDGRNKYRMWEEEIIKGISRSHVDMQDVNRITRPHPTLLKSEE